MPSTRSTVFVVAYVLIATERFNQTLVALGGATAMFFLPSINSDEVFYARDTGVNWDVLFLLLGMMIIVSVVRQTGLFEYMAIWSAKRAKGSPLRIMILLILVTALGTAVLDNVTTVLLIAPVTLLVCDRLEINPAPFLDRRGPRRQHRRRGDPGRRPDQHHHRHRRPAELHYVHGQHGAGGAHRPRRPADRCCPGCFQASSPSIPRGSPMS